MSHQRDLSSSIASLLASDKTVDDLVRNPKVSRVRALKAERKRKQELFKQRQEKKLLRNKEHIVPDAATNAEKERLYRKIATKGVVTLFNAVRKVQGATTDADDKVQKLTKSSFLDMLKQKAPAPKQVVETETETTWDVLDDDFVHQFEESEEE